MTKMQQVKNEELERIEKTLQKLRTFDNFYENFKTEQDMMMALTQIFHSFSQNNAVNKSTDK